MSVKKPKTTPRVGTGPSEELKHSPFAKLSAPALAPPTAIEATPEPKVAPTARGRLTLRRETKHRGGKAVVIVSGFEAIRDYDASAIEGLAKECKRRLGCGGTVDDGEIVLQGDRAGEVAEMLRGMGFRVVGVVS